jgi:hypothetical protein
MQPLIGYFMLGTWTAIVWMAVRLVRDVGASVRDRVRVHTARAHKS